MFPGAGKAGVSKGQRVSQDCAVCSAMTSAGHFPQRRRGQALWERFDLIICRFASYANIFVDGNMTMVCVYL